MAQPAPSSSLPVTCVLSRHFWCPEELLWETTSQGQRVRDKQQEVRNTGYSVGRDGEVGNATYPIILKVEGTIAGSPVAPGTEEEAVLWVKAFPGRTVMEAERGELPECGCPLRYMVTGRCPARRRLHGQARGGEWGSPPHPSP